MDKEELTTWPFKVRESSGTLSALYIVFKQFFCLILANLSTLCLQVLGTIFPLVNSILVRRHFRLGSLYLEKSVISPHAPTSPKYKFLYCNIIFYICLCGFLWFEHVPQNSCAGNLIPIASVLRGGTFGRQSPHEQINPFTNEWINELMGY